MGARFKHFKNQKHNEELTKIPHLFKAEHDEEKKLSKITIYGIIGDSWWGESISASDIDRALNDAGENDLEIRLNSPGGDAFDGVAIYNRLKDYKGKVTTYIDGWACSAASLIPPASNEVIMGTGAMIMIHEGSSGVWGTKKDFLKEAEVLGKLESGIIDIYMQVAKVEREEIVQMVDNETWFTADEAIAIGFASATTKIVDDKGAYNNQTQMSAEEYKLSVLGRFKKQPQQNIMNKFKRA